MEGSAEPGSVHGHVGKSECRGAEDCPRRVSEEKHVSTPHLYAKTEVQELLKKKREVRGGLVNIRIQGADDLKKLWDVWYMTCRLSRLGKDIRRMGRDHHRDLKKQWVEELWMAWDRRDTAHMWRIARWTS